MIESPAAIEVQGVVKRFGSALVLDGIDLCIDKGEFITLLGPSGCGKTTLLRIIACLEKQDSGTVLKNGIDVRKISARERNFAVVFQSYALFPNMTARENIAFGLRYRGLDKTTIDKKVSQSIEMVHLEESENKFPAELSGGQQQRVALARAVVLEPNLLLLDEPLSALDAKVRAGLRDQIREIQTRLGITTIMVTHDQVEALTMSDRIAVMNHGRIEHIGTPDEIYNKPQSLFVGNFIGAMNLFPEGFVAPGSPIAAIRPEDFSLDARDPDSLTFAGELLSFEFTGPRTILHCRSTIDQSITIRAEIANHAVGSKPMAAGTPITLSVPRASTHFFRDGQRV